MKPSRFNKQLKPAVVGQLSVMGNSRSGDIREIVTVALYFDRECQDRMCYVMALKTRSSLVFFFFVTTRALATNAPSLGSDRIMKTPS